VPLLDEKSKSPKKVIQPSSVFGTPMTHRRGR